MQGKQCGSEALLWITVEAAVQRVLMPHTASTAAWASASPSSAAAVERKGSPGKHTKEQKALLCLEFADLQTGCPVQSVTSTCCLWVAPCLGKEGVMG